MIRGFRATFISLLMVFSSLWSRGGDFVLYESGSIATLLIMREGIRGETIFEQIDAPIPLFKGISQQQDLEKWLSNGAPGHTQWILYEADLRREQLIESYCLNRHYWIDPPDALLLKKVFFRRGMEPIAEAARKKIGPRPRQEGVDRRKVWNPPVSYWDEKGITAAKEFDVYRLECQGTELDGYLVHFYYQKKWSDFPFPCWIEVCDTGVSGSKMAGKWMGRDLRGSVKEVPKRHPQLQKVVLDEGRKLHISLETPAYWEGWSLLLYREGMAPIYIPCEGEGQLGLLADCSRVDNGSYTVRLFYQKPIPASLEFPEPVVLQ